MFKDTEEFSEWYNNVIEKAELVDKRYTVKGMNVWLPSGWSLMRNIDEYLRTEFISSGHGEVCFPLVIPENLFAKEAEHIKGFGGEVFWITHAGEDELDIKMLLRPTSETAMYPMFSLWIRTHGDLPLKIFQIVDVFRYETKQTRTFMRVRQIHFFEAHTAHATYEGAEGQIEEDINIWKKVSEKLCLPYLLLRRPDWDKFAGAHYSIGADTILPTGRTLQIATIHQYRQNFSIPYEIKYLKKDGSHDYVHQTTFGMSERLIGAVIAVHGDDKGLIMPPEIAPVQVVIVPIFGSMKDEIIKKSNEISRRLTDMGLKTHVDDRDQYTPGYKFYDWEMKGVPLRLELGPKDMEKKQVTYARRDMKKKVALNENNLSEIPDILKDIQKNLYITAQKELEEKIKDAETLADIKEWAGVSKTYWCGDEKCGHIIEEETDKNVLGTPARSGKIEGKKCIICGKEPAYEVYLGRSV